MRKRNHRDLILIRSVKKALTEKWNLNWGLKDEKVKKKKKTKKRREGTKPMRPGVEEGSKKQEQLGQIAQAGKWPARSKNWSKTFVARIG